MLTRYMPGPSRGSYVLTLESVCVCAVQGLGLLKPKGPGVAGTEADPDPVADTAPACLGHGHRELRQLLPKRKAKEGM